MFVGAKLIVAGGGGGEECYALFGVCPVYEGDGVFYRFCIFGFDMVGFGEGEESVVVGAYRI